MKNLPHINIYNNILGLKKRFVSDVFDNANNAFDEMDAETKKAEVKDDSKETQTEKVVKKGDLDIEKAKESLKAVAAPRKLGEDMFNEMDNINSAINDFLNPNLSTKDKINAIKKVCSESESVEIHSVVFKLSSSANNKGALIGKPPSSDNYFFIDEKNIKSFTNVMNKSIMLEKKLSMN